MKKNLIILSGFLLISSFCVSACSNSSTPNNNTTSQSTTHIDDTQLLLNEYACTLKVGETFTLVPTYGDYTGSYRWFSDKPSIAKVDNGIVTGLSIGLAEISVMSEDGKSTSCIFTIIEADKKEITYSINYYFESLAGDFVLDENETITGTALEDEFVDGIIKTYPGFTFDENNPNNVIYESISESQHEYAVYYVRNSYQVTVYGGESSKEKAKYEETIAITPYVEGSSIDVDGEGALINGNNITIGTSDITVTCQSNKYLLIDSETLVNTTNATITASLNVSDDPSFSGVVFGYVNKDMSSDGIARSYLLGVINNKIALCEKEDGVTKPIKVSDRTIELGKYTLKVETSADYSISCYVDNVVALTVSASEINNAGCEYIVDPGLIGCYSESGIHLTSNISIAKGEMTLNEAKDYYKKIANEFAYSQHEFNSSTCYVDEGITQINLKDVPAYSDAAREVENSINNATSLDEIFVAIKGSVDRKIECQKEYTKFAFMKMLSLINYSFFMTRIRTQDCLCEGYSDLTMNCDFNKNDPRWYVPLCYRLRVDGQVGLLDEMELAIMRANTIDDMYEISDRFACDLVRAFCYRSYEFYYWSENAQPNTISRNQWWELWNYNSPAKGVTGYVPFEYVGNALPGYVHETDYRLPRVFYGPAGGSVEAVEGINNCIASFDWLLKWQTSTITYTVTLNTNGGSVPSTSLTYTSGYGANNTLPTPTREGYEFDGWYTSRLLQGSACANNLISDENNRDLTLYAAWKKNGVRVDPDFTPASYITENMVIQQMKPITVSGTGKEGLDIEVNFDGDTKTTTVADGKWSVTFNAKEATYTPKTMEISGGEISYTFNNILIGEVWVTTGQSNMDMLPTWGGLNLIGQLGNVPNLSKIRTFRQFIDTDPTEDAYNQERWIYNKSGWDAMDKSILSTYFACNLQAELGIPVGVLNSSRGGTYIEEWLTEENIASTYNTMPDDVKNEIGSRYYNCMTKDLEGLECAGVVWYQGENNWDHPEEYKSQYKKLVEQYRTIFNDPNLPIIAQQLVQFGLAPYDFSMMRLAQWEVAKEIDNAYCACAIDSGCEWDIHPQDKEIPAKRISDLALEYVYRTISDSQCYEPVSANDNNAQIVISFEEGKTIYAKNGYLNHFQVKLNNGQIVSVTATISNNKVVINGVQDATQVIYAYGSWLGDITLYGGNDKPVVPFIINITK